MKVGRICLKKPKIVLGLRLLFRHSLQKLVYGAAIECRRGRKGFLRRGKLPQCLRNPALFDLSAVARGIEVRFHLHYNKSYQIATKESLDTAEDSSTRYPIT